MMDLRERGEGDAINDEHINKACSELIASVIRRNGGVSSYTYVCWDARESGVDIGDWEVVVRPIRVAQAGQS